MKFNFAEAALEAEKKVIQEMREKGRVEAFDFSDDIRSGRSTIREMIGTSDGAKEFLEKIVFDLAAGRQEVPLLYKDIFDTQTDANFPEVMKEKTVGNVQTVFLEKFEGGEIKFGSFGAGEEKTIIMRTWASGIEYDEDIAEYNQTWRVASIGESFGKSYNHLLNHLHLGLIVNGVYSGTTTGSSSQADILAAAKAQKGQGVKKPGVAQKIKGDITDKAVWRAAMQILPKGSVVLHNSFDTLAIQNVFASDLYVNNKPGQLQQHFANIKFVPYDGASIDVGEDHYNYQGVPQGTVYLLVPKLNFKEKVKHDLRTDSGDGDLSRLILSQVVGRTRRGALAALGGENGAIKISAA